MCLYNIRRKYGGEYYSSMRICLKMHSFILIIGLGDCLQLWHNVPMISQKLQQDVQEILQDLEEVLAVYMEAQQRIGKERREIINQFAKQLESLEVRHARAYSTENVWRPLNLMF